MRTSPNVIVTGTPGVGKTVHCEQLAQEIGLKHLSVNQVAKDRDCYETYDEERKSWVVDEDKVGYYRSSEESSVVPHVFFLSIAFLSVRGVFQCGAEPIGIDARDVMEDMLI